MVRLSHLCESLPPGSVRFVEPAEEVADPEITGVQIDSRRVEPGDLFVAVAGARHDGAAFAAEAVRRGAVAVLAGPGRLPAGWDPKVPWLEVGLESVPEVEPEAGRDLGGPRALDHGGPRALDHGGPRAQDHGGPRALAGPLAVRVHGHPERELVLAAVTGTNGKSTVVALLAAILEAAGRPTGLIGTLGYRFGDDLTTGERTTPEAPELVRLLRRWRDRGAEAVAMEASSHALDLERLTGLAFDVAVFTNLTQDHLDWHGDFESYFASKRRLFGMLKPGGGASANLDDPFGRRLAGELSGDLAGSGRLVTFGTTAAAAVRARDVRLHERGIEALVETPRGSFPVTSPLLGRYNLENLLAAIAASEVLGLDHEAVVAGIAARGPLPGRLELVDGPPEVAGERPFPVYVDYAHTPGALEALLRAVTELSGRRIILVFGAGGDRDQQKRHPMGRIAGELAELPILTSDNPRSEDPLQIIHMVEKGLEESGSTTYRIVPDRREAIHRAIAVAGPGDAVVIAGKGHEEIQQIGQRKLPFSDRVEAAKALDERFRETADR